MLGGSAVATPTKPRKLRESSEVFPDTPEGPNPTSNGTGPYAGSPRGKGDSQAKFGSPKGGKKASPPTGESSVSRTAIRSASRTIAEQLVANAAAHAASQAADAGSFSKAASKEAVGMCPTASLPLLLLLAIWRRCCKSPLVFRHVLQIAAVLAATGMLLSYAYLRTTADRVLVDYSALTARPNEARQPLVP